MNTTATVSHTCSQADLCLFEELFNRPLVVMLLVLFEEEFKRPRVAELLVSNVSKIRDENREKVGN